MAWLVRSKEEKPRAEIDKDWKKGTGLMINREIFPPGEVRVNLEYEPEFKLWASARNVGDDGMIWIAIMGITPFRIVPLFLKSAFRKRGQIIYAEIGGRMTEEWNNTVVAVYAGRGDLADRITSEAGRRGVRFYFPKYFMQEVTPEGRYTWKAFETIKELYSELERLGIGAFELRTARLYAVLADRGVRRIDSLHPLPELGIGISEAGINWYELKEVLPDAIAGRFERNDWSLIRDVADDSTEEVLGVKK